MLHSIGKSRNCKFAESRKQRSHGYILIALMMMITLLAFAALVQLPEIKFQIQRDREQELRNRGQAYMRAIQRFYKKFGRYPTRIEELENTNNIRFIRKLYKDPLNRDPETGKERDFKLLHLTDIATNVMGGQAGLGQMAALSGALGGSQRPSGFSPTMGQLAGAGMQGGLTNGGDINASNDESGDGADEKSPGNSADASKPDSKPDSTGLTGKVFGGGPIVGVASMSKAKSIREFDNKKHYKDWLFYYDPTGDRGGLLTGPVVPSLVNKGLNGLTGMQSGLGTGQPNSAQVPGLTTQPAQSTTSTPEMPPDQ